MVARDRARNVLLWDVRLRDETLVNSMLRRADERGLKLTQDQEYSSKILSRSLLLRRTSYAKTQLFPESTE